MTSAGPSEVQSPGGTAGAAAPGGLLPNRRVWITVASLATAIALVRNGGLERVVGPVVDHAVINIITLILCSRSWCRWWSGCGVKAAIHRG